MRILSISDFTSMAGNNVNLHILSDLLPEIIISFTMWYPEPEDDNPGIDLEEKKPEITIDEFDKIQLQIGQVIACEEVKKSKKLLCSQVKIGSEVRQIVSGIKAHYSPEDMVGKKVVVVTNLKPAKLAGIESQGMILCAEDAEGNLALVTAEKDMPHGAEIR